MLVPSAYARAPPANVTADQNANTSRTGVEKPAERGLCAAAAMSGHGPGPGPAAAYGEWAWSVGRRVGAAGSGFRPVKLGSVTSLDDCYESDSDDSCDCIVGGAGCLAALADRLQAEVEALLELDCERQREQHAKSHGICAIGLRSTLESAVQSIMFESEDEPYGVRGASVIIKLRNPKGEIRDLGEIVLDKSKVCTFKLTLVLQEERKLSIAIRNWLGQFTHSKQDHLFSPNYSLSKKKLYRS